MCSEVITTVFKYATAVVLVCLLPIVAAAEANTPPIQRFHFNQTQINKPDAAIPLTNISALSPQNKISNKQAESQNNEPKQQDPEEPNNIFLNFQDVSLASIVDHLAEQRKINVITHKDLVNTKVSLRTREPFTLSRAWEILLTLLEMHGFTIVNVNNVHRVVPNKENIHQPIPIYSSANGIEPEDLPSSDIVIRYIYFLHNIKAETALSVLNQMLDTPIQINSDLDVCLIKEKSLSIKSAMKVIKELDQGGLRQAIKMVPIQYADPNNIARLFNSEIISKKGREQERVRFIAAAKKEVNYFSQNVKIIPNSERGVLFLLGQEMDLQKIVEFIKKYLDVPIDDAESRLHVKEILYYDADKLKRIIKQIIRPPQGPKDTEFNYFQDVIITAESPGTNSSENFGSGNRLIVACNSDDWIRLEKIIDSIDKQQPQVALEVMIVDVSLDMTRKLSAHLRDTGIGVFGKDTAFRLANMYDVPEGAITDNLRESSMHDILNSTSGEEAGQQSSVITLGKTLEGVKSSAWGIIKTLLVKDNANIISQPFQIVNNRERCEILSTESKRVAGELKHTYGDRLIQSQVDVSAKTNTIITPRVNADGVIDLTVEISVEDFKDRAAAHPVTNSRKLSTRVSMGVGEVLVLGGLTRSSLREEHYDTPLLGSVPILGNFFKSKQKHSAKAHLYLFIRPSIIKPQFSGRADDYTQFKIDYAKHQIFNVDTYSKSKDPVQRFFFKPRRHSISETVNNVKDKKFSYIDDFVEKKYLPPTADMRHDPYYRARESLSGRNKLASTKNSGNRRGHLNLKRRSTRRKSA